MSWNYQLIQSGILIGGIVVAQIITRTLIGRTLKISGFNVQRRRLVVRLINTLSIILSLVFLAGIWGVSQDRLLVFLSSSLTILGVGFFAQWSILSNITASLILFFSHPLKIGSVIEVLDKDFAIKGTITDITFFYVYISTEDGKRLSIPNNVLLVKSISLISE